MMMIPPSSSPSSPSPAVLKARFARNEVLTSKSSATQQWHALASSLDTSMFANAETIATTEEIIADFIRDGFSLHVALLTLIGIIEFKIPHSVFTGDKRVLGVRPYIAIIERLFEKHATTGGGEVFAKLDKSPHGRYTLANQLASVVVVSWKHAREISCEVLRMSSRHGYKLYEQAYIARTLDAGWFQKQHGKIECAKFRDFIVVYERIIAFLCGGVRREKDAAENKVCKFLKGDGDNAVFYRVATMMIVDF